LYRNIARNKRNTIIILGLLVGIIAAPLIYLGFEAGDFTFVGGIGIFLLIYTLAQYFIGGRLALSASHAQEISKQDNPRLWNAVENLAISEGMPMPKVYIIPDNGLNAFAAGRDPEHAVVAFTQGLLNSLTNTELEGVVAHELAHIKNYDIRINTVIFGLVAGVLIVGDIMLRLGLSGVRNRNTAIFGMGFLAVAAFSLIVGYLIAPILSAAVSREREYLADASAVEMTRFPDGIKGALEKLKNNSIPMEREVSGLSHMYFSLPRVGNFFTKLYASHPPLENRIERIEQSAGGF
jgi:heat shock protein HtpX